uniref:Uncharacterized protein n=1 Tax=Chromera velia CCMP2878 TaxID=1169474 RepID=A0A0G4G7R9_9ALVE|eukprot:Cvel_20647.t1-p1 / transcript=Cvel_20647.t1 / gene=Cvel_20647 / organism=Chromera_velia_CCMP2878 / gene_product=hypothetical protein / transcript_product=hypothetical protein / location=Cvel_scaffold1873:17033-17578(-) / protein_length=182 / sequence_SO=supercontig / SO=protein_coding / is_pseudo=false
MQPSMQPMSASRGTTGGSRWWHQHCQHSVNDVLDAAVEKEGLCPHDGQKVIVQYPFTHPRGDPERQMMREKVRKDIQTFLMAKGASREEACLHEDTWFLQGGQDGEVNTREEEEDFGSAHFVFKRARSVIKRGAKYDLLVDLLKKQEEYETPEDETFAARQLDVKLSTGYFVRQAVRSAGQR